VLRKHDCVVLVVGAGISTNAGIADFRTEGTGLYSNVGDLNVPYAQAVFDKKFFKKNPVPFYKVANKILLGSKLPTFCHHFLALLSKMDILSRVYTQNFDNLEVDAGVPADKLVQAHRSFGSAQCSNDECDSERYSASGLERRSYGKRSPSARAAAVI
jgi:NAD-dependent histone deacetylase SIR2